MDRQQKILNIFTQLEQALEQTKHHAATLTAFAEMLLALNETPQEFGEELKRWAAISMYYFGKISLARLNIPISLLDEADAEKEIKTVMG